MPGGPDNGVAIVDGSIDFAGGVNSYVTTTIASDRNPNGLQRNQVSWMNNATVRGGGITQRPGMQKRGNLPADAVGLYQGKFMYEPSSADPYEIMAIGGHIWKINVDDPANGQDLSALFNVYLPADIERYFFCQAEQFLVIQCGDLLHLPLFWDGSILRRSLGLSGMGLNPALYGDGSHVYGNFSFTSTAGFTFPAIGANKVIATTDTSHVGAVGTHVFMFNAYTFTPSTGVLTSYVAIVASWQIVNVIPNTSVELTLLGTSQPGITYGNSVNFWTLVDEPTVFTAGTPELPPAGPMDYYMGRLWYAQNRQYAAGDIVGGPKGTQAYNFRDSVLKVTENPLALGGDGFTVPTNSGNIRALKHSANINTQLGQGQLYIFTRRSVYALTVPVTRNDWIAADNNKQPLQTVVQLTNGAVNDRSVTAQNGDLFFQSLEPSIRSLITAIRYYDQWGNVPISINEDRILRFNDRGLMQFSSGLSFDNRMLQTVLPFQTPVGVAHKAIIPLNFDVVSTLEKKLPPVWEGMYEGLNYLELSSGDFGGRPRAFTTVWSERERNMQLWEITTSDRFEGDDNRVTWYIEFPAYTFNDEFMLKKLLSAELWLDRLYGNVDFAMDYRVDGDPCWYPWNRWQLCTARNSCEDVHNPNCLYPTQYSESFRQTINMPKPPEVCQTVSKRPAYIGYQFQPRLTIHGFCRIRGILLKATEFKESMYNNLVCPT